MRNNQVQYAQRLCQRAISIFGGRLEDLAIALETSPNTLLALRAGRDVPASIVLGLLAIVDGNPEGISVFRRETAEIHASRDGQVACRTLGKRTLASEIRLAGDRTEYLPVKRGQIGSLYVLAGIIELSTGYSKNGVRLEIGDYAEIPAKTVAICNIGVQIARILVFWHNDRLNS